MSVSCEAPAHRFSVIIPTYNRREMVVRAIDSVLEQDAGSPFEVIVVDDGSTDGTSEALIDRYRDVPAVRVVQRPHRGPSAARNAGFAQSHGEWICFLDSDDILLPHVFARVHETLQSWPDLAFLSVEGVTVGSDAASQSHIVRANPGWHGAGFSQTPLRRSMLPPHGARSSAAELTRSRLFRALLDGDLFYLSGLYIRRAALVAAGPFNPRYRLLEDWDFHLRLSLQGDGALLDEAGFIRNIGNDDQLSRRMSPLRYALMHMRVLRNTRTSNLVRERVEQRDLDLAEHNARYWLGRSLLQHSRRRLARRLLMTSMVNRFKPLKCAYLLAYSFGLTTRSKKSAASSRGAAVHWCRSDA